MNVNDFDLTANGIFRNKSNHKPITNIDKSLMIRSKLRLFPDSFTGIAKHIERFKRPKYSYVRNGLVLGNNIHDHYKYIHAYEDTKQIRCDRCGRPVIAGDIHLCVQCARSFNLSIHTSRTLSRISRQSTSI